MAAHPLGTERPVAVLRDRREEIVEAWEAAVRASPAGPRLEGPSLRDHLPEILDRVASLLAPAASPDGDPREHGKTRASQGVSVVAVLAELGILRRVVLDFWAADGPLQVEALRALDRVLDQSAIEAAKRITETHDAFFRGVDAISRASLEARDTDELLRRLLEEIVRTTGAVDSAAILLRQGDRLVVRAAVGGPEDAEAERRAEALGGAVRFSVSDTGPGIAPGEAEHVFEPYRRGSAPGYEATGLGLAIASGIVAAHGGGIGVDSVPGEGATFWFTLPAAAAPTASKA